MFTKIQLSMHCNLKLIRTNSKKEKENDIMLKVFKYLQKNEWLMILGSLIFVIGQVWLDLRLPDYMSDITTFVITDGSKMSDILKSGA